PPFVPTERDGRLYGRGSADDKAGIATHLAAFRAHGGRPPVGVTVFVEGEEESGSPSLGRLLAARRDTLAADVIVIADSDNWSVDTPALTVSLRGLADCVVEVATLDHGLHSGLWGGVVPDALSGLVRLRARAKISMRVAPGGDAAAHLDALTAHLQAHAPWGAQLTVTPGDIGEPYAIEASGAVYDAVRAAFRQAWGVDPVDMGMGGSIP